MGFLFAFLVGVFVGDRHAVPMISSVPMIYYQQPTSLDSTALWEKQRGDRWRKEAGRMHCKMNGLGPTGGFCMESAAGATYVLHAHVGDEGATCSASSAGLLGTPSGDGPRPHGPNFTGSSWPIVSQESPSIRSTPEELTDDKSIRPEDSASYMSETAAALSRPAGLRLAPAHLSRSAPVRCLDFVNHAPRRRMRTLSRKKLGSMPCKGG